MTWTKLGDEFDDDAAELTSDEYRGYVESLNLSNRRLLDLSVPKQMWRRYTCTVDPAAVELGLVAKAWWQDRGDWWYVGLRRPEWQQTREQVETRRETNLRAQWHRRGRHDLCVPGKCSALSSADTSADDVPDTVNDNAADPGRDGTGTGQALQDGPPARNDYGLGRCSICDGFEKLGPDGTCSVCVISHASVAS